jgi:hypothetical protein
MLKADFLSIDGLQSFVYTDAATAGNTTQTVDNARITFTEVKSFGEAAVKGYQISGVSLTFPVDSVTVTPKLGDYVAVDGSTYEVTKADKATAQTRWRLMAERAFIEGDWSGLVNVQRAALPVNAAGAQIETYTTVTGNVQAIIVNNDDAADMLARLSTRGDKQSLNFYMAQSVVVYPTDRIQYNSRNYRITAIEDEGRVARLKRIVAEIYP